MMLLMLRVLQLEARHLACWLLRGHLVLQGRGDDTLLLHHGTRWSLALSLSLGL